MTQNQRKIGPRGRRIEYQASQSPHEYFDYMRRHQNEMVGIITAIKTKE
jgi:hypothetical protein